LIYSWIPVDLFNKMLDHYRYIRKYNLPFHGKLFLNIMHMYIFSYSHKTGKYGITILRTFFMWFIMPSVTINRFKIYLLKCSNKNIEICSTTFNRSPIMYHKVMSSFQGCRYVGQHTEFSLTSAITKNMHLDFRRRRNSVTANLT
jgi:hypothetical protein